MNFKPVYSFSSVYETDFDMLYEKGIRALIFDIDNTLVTYDDPVPDEKLMEFFKNLRNKGFKLYLLSNNNRKRVSIFGEAAGIDYRGRGLKPLLIFIKKAMRIMGVSKAETALIGDQIFTDVLGANRAGITSVLINPISQKEDKFVAFKRHLEKIISK